MESRIDTVKDKALPVAVAQRNRPVAVDPQNDTRNLKADAGTVVADAQLAPSAATEMSKPQGEANQTLILVSLGAALAAIMGIAYFVRKTKATQH
ncbi:MAG TPA: hypothetical protein PLY93_04985 [Turneriella sp.]|nr:hypothetical protein [Turneriella sp.]